MPGHEEREQTYNSLTDTLIAGVQPRIMSDIMGREMSSLREFLYVYIKLNRYCTYVSLLWPSNLVVSSCNTLSITEVIVLQHRYTPVYPRPY